MLRKFFNQLMKFFRIRVNAVTESMKSDIDDITLEVEDCETFLSTHRNKVIKFSAFVKNQIKNKEIKEKHIKKLKNMIENIKGKDYTDEIKREKIRECIRVIKNIEAEIKYLDEEITKNEKSVNTFSSQIKENEKRLGFLKDNLIKLSMKNENLKLRKSINNSFSLFGESNKVNNIKNIEEKIQMINSEIEAGEEFLPDADNGFNILNECVKEEEDKAIEEELNRVLK